MARAWMTFIIFIILPWDRYKMQDTPPNPEVYSDMKDHLQEGKLDVSEPSSKIVIERNLVVSNPKQKDIVQEHNAYSMAAAAIKNFKGDVLGYVTPWNNHGYDVAKTFRAKFSHVSPVWLQVKPYDGNYRIEGGHDIDKNWIAEVKKSNNVKFVPRLLFDGWSGRDYGAVFGSHKNTEKLSDTIISFTKENNFDGLVVEIWSQFNGQYKEYLGDFVKKLAKSFMDEKLLFILVIPPAVYHGNQQGMFLKEDFDNLVDYVSAFSLMTYDYSNVQRPGPNSPIQWMKKCIESLVPKKNDKNRKKILLGLNFYGNDYSNVGGGPIIGRQYIETLAKEKVKIIFDDKSVEHMMEYTTKDGKHVIFYPTLYSIQERIKLAKKMKTGLSIWEIGQGLDYFYDLF